jgi:hypothetical protein
MNNDPRHIQGGAAGAEGVDQQKKRVGGVSQRARLQQRPPHE